MSSCVYHSPGGWFFQYSFSMFLYADYRQEHSLLYCRASDNFSHNSEKKNPTNIPVSPEAKTCTLPVAYPSLPLSVSFAEFLMILCHASDFIFLAKFLLAEAIRFATCPDKNYPISFAHRIAISIQFWHCKKIPPPSRYLVSSVARLMPCPPIG